MADYEYSDDYRVYFSSTNSTRLTALCQEFEIHWCTAWGTDANMIISPLHKQAEFPVVNLGRISTTTDIGGFVQFHHGDIHWKAEAIHAHVGDRPYAFVDDDIDERGIAYARERNKQIPTLWLPVRCSVGLTDQHVIDLLQFAIRCRAMV